MSAPAEFARYNPFPSFSRWADSEVSTAVFDRYAARLAAARRTATPEQLERALAESLRAAAVDTNAIEGVFTTDRGFTMSVATQAAGWESAMARKGEAARGAFADSLNGFELILDAATNRYPLTETWIRDLHSTLLHSQKTYDVWTAVGMRARPLPRGQYKEFENSPSLPDGTVHAYAPVLDVAPEMHRLVRELNSDKFQEAHPVLQASYAHYALVAIHPFSDGNGRVSRALASMFLYRNPGIPFVVFDDQKIDYFDALHAADQGRYGAFVQFVGARATDTTSLLSIQLAAAAAPSIEESLAALSSAAPNSPERERLVLAALRLKELALGEIERRLAEVAPPADLECRVYGSSTTSVPLPNGFEGVGREGLILTSLQSFHPRSALVVGPGGVGVRADGGDRADLVLSDGKGFDAEFTLQEFEPAETSSARQKVKAWAEGFWDRMFAELAAQASAN